MLFESISEGADGDVEIRLKRGSSSPDDVGGLLFFLLFEEDPDFLCRGGGEVDEEDTGLPGREISWKRGVRGERGGELGGEVDGD